MGSMSELSEAAERCISHSDASGDRRIEPTPTTPEPVWSSWIAQQSFKAADPAQLFGDRRRLVVVAPHPDDEILAAGGLMQAATSLGIPVALVAVTNGTGSHPGSACWPVERLEFERPRETRLALTRLGVHAEQIRLAFEDGTLAKSAKKLASAISAAIHESDLVVTTWRIDGHPDHEATGEACAVASGRVGARLLEAPVWAWQWALPADKRLPWTCALKLDLSTEAVQLKTLALTAFESQLSIDPATSGEPILGPAIVQRAARDFELFFA
jgi:LmbE family N-acetylglucosaminyl deacetylase